MSPCGASPKRWWPWLVVGLLLSCVCLLAQLAPAPAAGRQETNALPQLSLWDSTFNLRLSGGYKDNLLLGPVNPVESPFIATGLEYFLWRLPLQGPEFYFYVSADDIRFLDHTETEKEQTIIAQASLKHAFNARWQLNLTLQYVFQDAIFDASSTETNLASVRAYGHLIAFKPGLRRYFDTNLWLDFEFTAARQNLMEPLDDYTETGPKLGLTRSYGHRSELSLAYSFLYQPYDKRSALGADATPIPRRELTFDKHRLELSWRHFWNPARSLKTVTRGGVERNRDNGARYFDYVKYFAVQEFHYTPKAWNFRLQGRYTQYDYDVQNVSLLDPTLRSKQNFSGSIRLERELLKGLKVFADAEHERSVSNIGVDEYRVNTVSAGFDYEF